MKQQTRNDQRHGFNEEWNEEWRSPLKSRHRTDERIREDIYERIMSRAQIDASDVTVEVRDGKVTLSGEVPLRRMKQEIEDIVDGCPGVKDVDSDIRMGA
jgi:osmotically-inducible protein OsmY